MNEMADKEQELLGTKQWDKLCKEYPLLDFSFQDGYAEEFRIILKAMGWTPPCHGTGEKKLDSPELCGKVLKSGKKCRNVKKVATELTCRFHKPKSQNTCNFGRTNDYGHGEM